jgi:pimeloyl-ACP methyl ester carboxylesterase
VPPQRLPHVSPARLAWLRRLFGLLQLLNTTLAARIAFRLFLRPFRRPMRDEDCAAMGLARQHEAGAGDERVAVYEWGGGERTVIIVHGWGSRAARFTPLAMALVARGWRVLAFDAPGHGASPGGSSSLPQFMAALETIASTRGPVHALAGHSLGALAIACSHASARPAWADRVQRVVLVSMPAGAPFLIDSFLQMMRIGPATAARLLDLFRRRFGGEPAGYASMPGAAQLDASLLLVHDRDDDIVPFAHSAALTTLVGDCRLLATSGLGHSGLTRDAATIAQIAHFLDGQAS